MVCAQSDFFGGTAVVDLSSIPSGGWMVAFYTTGCGHCRNLRPEYIRAASELAQFCKEAKLGAIDCNANAGLCQQFALGGYPSLKVFLNGNEMGDYSGIRDASSIVQYIKESMSSAGMQCSRGRLRLHTSRQRNIPAKQSKWKLFLSKFK